jgi:hypothetical protein
MTYERVFPFFAVAFAIIYLIVEQYNFALFTYHPRIGEFDWLAKPSRSGPAMHWFGWLATSFLAATALSAAAYPVLKRVAVPIWMAWVVPLAVMAAFAYILAKVFLLR